MKRWITLCALFVVMQVILTFWSNWDAGEQQGAVAKGPLVALAAADVDALTFEESGGKSLKIEKVGGHWQLPGSLGFPADTVRLQGLIEKITLLKKGWPEASTPEAATRFKVSKENFAHRLTLSGQGYEPQVLYFGTSPGLRTLYFRLAGDPEIHSMEITAHELTTEPGDWIDTTVLHLKKEQLVEVKLPGIHLKRGTVRLEPVDLLQGEELNTKTLDGLVNRLTGLSISAILGAEPKVEEGLDNPVFSYSVTLENGASIDYRFTKKSAAPTEGGNADPQENTYILEASTLNQLVQVDGWQVDALKQVKRSELIVSKPSASNEQGPAAVSPHTQTP